MIFRQPPGSDPYLGYLVNGLNADLGRKEPWILGTRYDGTDLYLRFLARTNWVQVHVQSDAVGEGGLAAYDAANYQTTTEVDCRANRLRDVTVTPAGDRIVVFLIPVEYDGAGTKVLYDGVAADDLSAYTDFGV